MKVAYFTDTFAPEINGVANTLGKLSDYLEAKKIEHTFFTPDYNKERLREPDIVTKFKKVHRFQGITVNISPESCLSLPKARVIHSLCDRFAPDLVHVTTEFGIGFRGMRYAVANDIPLIMSSHTDYCKYLQYFNLNSLRPAVEKYLKWFYSFSHKTLVPSRHSLETLDNKKYQNLGIWSRGIDTVNFNADFRSDQVRKKLGIGDKFAFLYVGRLSPEKGLHTLLHAIGEINRLYPEKAVFVFTGDGPYAEIINRSGFKNIIMTGFKRGAELSEIYASCDCFTFPSGTETFGNTPLEALASGLPVVGISSGGVTDFLTHGHNALLSEDKEQFRFTYNMISLMKNELLRNTLTENGIKTASSRAWDRIFDELLLDYTTIIEKHLEHKESRVA